MSEVVDSNGPKDAPMEQTTNQAPGNNHPRAPYTAHKAAVMTSDPAAASGGAGETMVDAPAETDADGDSEAETLIQSPEKQRTAADSASVAGSASVPRTKDGDPSAAAIATDNDSSSRKRKRSLDDDEAFSTSSRRSSPLSSPRIPLHTPDSDSDVSNHIASRKSKPASRRPESDAADSDSPVEKSAKHQTRKRRPSDILPSISKQRAKNTGGGADPGSTERRETRSATYPRHKSEDRSPSPRPLRREHRRGVSTQLTLGDVERKKRGRPPAIQTKRSGSADHNRIVMSSDSDSDSPQQPRPDLHKYSSVDHDTMSPAKVTGPRKWRDKNGRTFLSRAASNNDLAAVKTKYAERPEDLNLPDNAGNTPLQIAALQGYVDIVRFLLENGCEVDTRNIDRDTALIDAVENGHVEVVKLLLIHGANPRLGNAKGDEPYELVPPDDENYDEIRALLADAKDKPNSHRVSMDYTDVPRDGASSRAASAASPRDSPPMMGPRSPPAGFGRRRTGRSESTRNDLLWQANTQENLKKLAAQGDVQGVANILNVLQKAETESLIAAAKAGHEEVLQYLLAMGDTEPDPDPIRHLKVGYNTPLLAAIGKGHPEVVKLLVEQSGFNPMRKLLKGKSYHEISAERRGEQWQKEYEILKTAYDKYAFKHRKATSPRATRDADKLKPRSGRRSQSPIPGKLGKSASPSLTHKQLPGKSPHSSERDRDLDAGTVDGMDRRKHNAAKRDIADLSVAVSSDQDQTVHSARKGHVKRRSQSDFSQQSNPDPDPAAHRRRRLVTGKEHRRRRSNVGASSDEDAVSVKGEARSGTLLKRTRESVSPGRPVAGAGENGRSAAKKRRTVIESSPEETRPGPRKSSIVSSSPVRERKALEESVLRGEKSGSDMAVQEKTAEAMDLDKPEVAAPTRTQVTAAPTSTVSESDIPLQRTETTEEIKTELVDPGPSEAELQAQREEEARKAEEAKRAEAERIAAEKAAEERRLAEEAARLKKAEEEAALRKKEEEERQEQRRKEEEERQELRRKEEEERQALRKKEEEERREQRRKEEEERQELRRREEEERQERVRRELEERQRRHEEQLKEQQRRQEELLREQQRRERLEAEERRRDALPALLKQSAILIDRNDPEARSGAWLKLFLPLYTAKSVQLDPNTPDANKNELWVPNFQVAGLLATKDLNLRNYTSLETRPVTMHERQRLWSVARNSLAYDVQTSHWNTTIKQAIQREEEQRPKFYAMEELFWVKLSDFEDQVFRHPHLASLKIGKQPISLRVLPSRQMNGNGQPPHSPASLPDLTNGKTPQLANGINPHSSPTANGNGFGYPRRED
ncbi:Ankyrin repeat protein [Cladophialophora carrionii]|uniref:Ankyrin repeat protein n=1 Tax=Cladophialophora carrionii TaxID=86049 RepID=A0A1C1CXC3_9EURO|nr:Ankyrin repeat protein [Cladophialophora carrionii]